MSEFQDHQDIEKLPLTTDGVPVRETVREVFLNPINGTPDNISKAGCLALALKSNEVGGKDQGYVVWNAWREAFPLLENFAFTGFRNYINFSNFEFREEAVFSRSRWGDKANFRGTIWGDRADFQGAVWGREADFRGAQWLEFSLLQTLPLPGLDLLSAVASKAFWPEGAWWSFGLSTLVIAHKTISLAALFLTGLALRNLFKLK
jgi:hypothetical protein